MKPMHANPRAPGPAQKLRQLERRHAGGAERPLGSYAVLLSTYLGSVAGATAYGRSKKLTLPERIPVSDLALLSLATFRASRLITKDSVTAVARAPFTRFSEAAGPGEVNEEVVGTGLRHAIGELVSCPFCISVWLATAGTFGLIAFPRATRAVCSMLAAVTASDSLQFAYSALERAD
jgi:hypothetical protein